MTTDTNADEILDKTEDELVNEIIAFAKEQFPGGNFSRSVVSELFWLNKGIREFDVTDPALRFKILKVNILVGQRLEQESLESEKKMLSELTEEYVDWAKTEGLGRVTKSQTDYFLIEKGLSLFTRNRDILHNRVNLILGRAGADESEEAFFS